ncbi:MAG: hypothetical protein FWE34_01710 [Defluviitaleaceae bacterium]|nr:hypothetical protein [Defluviitaleaceae bacterium]
MIGLEREYFDIYRHSKNNPNTILTKDDWGKLATLDGGGKSYKIIKNYPCNLCKGSF